MTGLDKTALERILGITIGDVSLYETALTHSSYANARSTTSNERLEYLGDGIVDMVIGEYLYLNYPDQKEGMLTRMRADVVKGESLARATDSLGLVRFLRYKLNGEVSVDVRGDLYEAIVAAVYLDLGFERAKNFVLRTLSPLISVDAKGVTDYKSRVFEWANENGREIEFFEVSRSGPDHDLTFVMGLRVDGSEVSRAEGRSKKSAEQLAASIFYKKINK